MRWRTKLYFECRKYVWFQIDIISTKIFLKGLTDKSKHLLLPPPIRFRLETVVVDECDESSISRNSLMKPLFAFGTQALLKNICQFISSDENIPLRNRRSEGSAL